MNKYKQMIERKNDLITRAEEILNDAETNKRELTDDEAAELAEIRDDVKKIKEALKIADELHEGQKEPKEEPNGAGAATGADDGQKDGGDDKQTRALEARDRAAFDAYLRGTVNERDYNLTKAANGAVIPTTIVNKIITKIYDICPILEKSTKYNVKGKIEIPTYVEGGDANGGITVSYATEFVELTSNIGKVTSIELSGYLAGALALVSRSLVNNSQFNLVDFVVDRMSEAIARFIEKELLNGTEDKVEGLSTVTNGVTAGAATAITADEVIRLKDKVKDAFQNNAMFTMSSSTRNALRLLKDTQGRYLLNDDISSPFGTTLLGKPVYVSDNMPEMAANAKTIYYGDFSGLATKFGEDMTIEVLREKYATQHAIGVVGWVEFDAKVEDPQKIAVLTMASK